MVIELYSALLSAELLKQTVPPPRFSWDVIRLMSPMHATLLESRATAHFAWSCDSVQVTSPAFNSLTSVTSYLYLGLQKAPHASTSKFRFKNRVALRGLGRKRV